jgi:hypothetical protein
MLPTISTINAEGAEKATPLAVRAITKASLEMGRVAYTSRTLAALRPDIVWPKPSIAAVTVLLATEPVTTNKATDGSDSSAKKLRKNK